MRCLSPLGAVARGLVAGVVGSLVQTVFLKATQRVRPRTPQGVFEPPEPAQVGEPNTETVARRFVEEMMQRGPLSPRQKKLAGELVHHGFGAAWGGLYGLLRESVPRRGGPLDGIAFGVLVWALGDELMQYAFELAAPPQRYPARVHAYALAGHVPYGLAVWKAYDMLR